MKILYLAVGKGGSDMSLISLIENLLPKGIVPFVVIAKSKSRTIQQLEKLGVDHATISAEFNVYPDRQTVKKRLLYPYYLWRKSWKKKRALVQLQSIYDSFSPDIIHTNVSVLDIGYLTAKKNNIPHIWHLREYMDLDFNFEWMPDMAHFRSCLNHKSTNYNLPITELIQKHHNIEENSKVVYNGVVKEFEPNLVWPKENYFLFAGALMHHKGAFDLIEGYSHYRKLNPNSTTRLKICATIRNNSEEKRIFQLIKDLKLINWVDFLGFRNDVVPLMRKARAVIVPSLNEGFGRIVTEAMEAGSVVIGRNEGGVKLQFDNGLKLTNKEIGIRFSTIKEMAKGLSIVEQLSKHDYESITHAAQETILSLYTQKSSANRVYSVYEEVLKKRN